MRPTAFYLPFRLDGLALGLDLGWLRRVLPAAAYTPLPGAPAVILGVLDVAGELVPLASLRHRLGLPPRALGLRDQLLWVDCGRWQLLLPVDSVDVSQGYAPDRLLPAEELPLPVPNLKGVLRTASGLLLIQDLPAFLSLAEEEALRRALHDHAD